MNLRGRTTNIFLFIFMLLGHHVVAQRHYVYLQSDDRRPFDVRIGSISHASNATGYLIIPQLSDSNYVFRVGHPQGDKPTAVFPVQIAHRDHGYQLICNEQECVMVDLQDASRIKGVPEETRKDAGKAEQAGGTNDVFTNSLALAIGDPQLTRTELIRQEPRPAVAPAEPPAKVKATAAPDDRSAAVTLAKKQEPVTKTKATASPGPERTVAVKEEPIVKAATPPKQVAPVVISEKHVDTVVRKELPVVIKGGEKPTAGPEPPRLIAEKQEASGHAYVYRAGKQAADTVDVFIAAATETKVVQAEKLTEQAKADIAADLGAAPATRKDSLVRVAAPVERKVRKDCKAMATAKDVEALKKRLAGIRDEDEKVAAALAAVKLRCHDTEQVKSICGSFVRNEGKYKFMDAAYPYVYDPSLYGQLETLLTDPYFVHRLKVLTGAINR